MLNHYEKGNESLILSSSRVARKGEHSPHFPSSHRRFGFFQRAHYNSLSLFQPLPQPSIQRAARNNENVIFRDSYHHHHHHRQDTVSSTILFSLPRDESRLFLLVRSSCLASRMPARFVTANFSCFSAPAVSFPVSSTCFQGGRCSVFFFRGGIFHAGFFGSG